MKKHIYIGFVSTDKDDIDYGCILKSAYSFDELSKNVSEIESNDFIHNSTNWCGCDEIERTLELENLTLTGRTIDLKSNILTIKGEDHDMWHIYPWTISIKEIWETGATE